MEIWSANTWISPAVAVIKTKYVQKNPLNDIVIQRINFDFIYQKIAVELVVAL